MSEFKILNLKPLDEQELYNGVYLLILNARTIPPHLSLTVSGKVYGISTKGPTFDKDVSLYLNYIKKHSIESVFVRLKLPVIYTDEQMLSSVRKVVKAYPRVDVGAATCLSPIKEFMNSAYQTEIHDVHLIFDLLPKLQDQGVIEGYYQMNLSGAICNDELLMQRYSVFEVNEAIHQSLQKQFI
ncbi:MAG: hypothetical protein CMP67_03555 [Flavobacteriales bacterium]|nr:hypothetical protein [Flavobacteriales bacterium]|tara:strand:- start:575 stop:1126 length:552 start_codon:yes stop_codon:yes gene_type:complete